MSKSWFSAEVCYSWTVVEESFQKSPWNQMSLKASRVCMFYIWRNTTALNFWTQVLKYLIAKTSKENVFRRLYVFVTWSSTFLAPLLSNVSTCASGCRASSSIESIRKQRRLYVTQLPRVSRGFDSTCLCPDTTDSSITRSCGRARIKALIRCIGREQSWSSLCCIYSSLKRNPELTPCLVMGGTVCLLWLDPEPRSDRRAVSITKSCDLSTVCSNTSRRPSLQKQATSTQHAR